MSSNVNKKLDLLGLSCPEPVFRTRSALDELNIGETLEVAADDPAAESDIQSLVKHLDYQVVNSNKKGNTIQIVIKKTK